MSAESRDISSSPLLSAGRANFSVGIAAVIVCFGFLAVLFGLVPGLMPSAGMQQFFLGLARCYAEHLPELRCDSIAQPDGYTTAFGLPYVIPVAIFDRLGFELTIAGKLVELVYLALSLFGSVLLFRALGVRWWLGLVLSTMFLASPIVFAQDGYGPLRAGFALVPLYAWVDLWIARSLAAQSSPKSALPAFLGGLLILVFLRCFALFMDGYSFVMGLALSGALILTVLVSLAQRRRLIPCLAIALVYALPTVLAYLLYSAYAGATVEMAVMPLDFFRGQGVDLYPLLVPSSMQWWASLLGISHSLTGWMSYSDGPSVVMVYLGWTLIAAFLIAAVAWIVVRRRLIGGACFPVLFLVFGAALLLALGPSLKISDFREEPRPERFIRFSDYLMPASEATLSLGTASLYQHVPGVRNMRAVYRWMLLLKLSAFLIAGLVLENLFRRPGAKYLAMVSLVLLVIELLPDLTQRAEHGQRQFAQFHRFQDGALRSLEALGLAGKRVLFLEAEAEADWNHFTANFLCPMAGLKCFNAGGDKSLVRARLTWPLELRELTRGRWVSGNLGSMLNHDQVDAVLVPLFSLRVAAYHWPPSTKEVDSRLENAMTLASSIGAVAVRQGWFVRLFPESTPEHRPEIPETAPIQFRIESWGPKAGSFQDGFNLQDDGRSALWVLFAENTDPNDSLVIKLDGYSLESFSADRVLSARLPFAADVARFPPGRYPVEVRDRDTGEIIDLGFFEVTERKQ